MAPKKDPYSVLGVAKAASEDDIRKVYRKLALKWHPDKHVADGNQAEATKRFKEISEAYQILSDKDRRRDLEASKAYHSSNDDDNNSHRSNASNSRPQSSTSKSGKTKDGRDWEWSWFTDAAAQSTDNGRHSAAAKERTFEAAFEEMERSFEDMQRAFSSGRSHGRDGQRGSGRREGKEERKRQDRRRGHTGDDIAGSFVFKDPFAMFEEFFGRRGVVDPLPQLFGALLSNPHNQRGIRGEFDGGDLDDRNSNSNHNHNNNDVRERAMKRKDRREANIFAVPTLFQNDFFNTAFQEAFQFENDSASRGDDNNNSASRRRAMTSSSRQVTSCCNVGGKRVVTKKIVNDKGERIVVEIDGVVTSDTLNGQPVRG